MERKVFLPGAVLAALTIVALTVFLMVNGIVREAADLFGVLIYSFPFVLLLIMFARWSGRKFILKEIIMRLSGSFLVYVVYLYMLLDVIYSLLHQQEGLRLIYPFSIPILFPFAYFIGYLLADLSFDLVMRKITK